MSSTASAKGEPIVFKFFGDEERKGHEETALRWLRETGVVPHVYRFESDNILIISRLSGNTLLQVEDSLTPAALAGVYRQVGKGLAKMVKFSYRPDSRHTWDNRKSAGVDLNFFWKSEFETFFDGIIETCREGLSRHRFGQKQLHHSIETLTEMRDQILERDVFLHVDDIHTNNLIVNEGELQGFIDLEMSRFGNDLYLLGSALQSATLDDPQQWRCILEGYEEEQGSSLSEQTLFLVKIFAPFQNWIRFAWYWGTDALPRWAIKRNVRQKTVEQLVRTFETVDSIV